MNKKKVRRTLDLEFFGSIAGLLLIVCAVAAFLDMENAPGFFVLVTGLGVLVNGILASLRFSKKNYVLVLFVMQLIMVEGFWK